ncbi:MAG: aminodeoxychorismate synthase component I [Bacteroidales bacterium]|jgi:para-aminobenzoate synthetase component 1|nr:aminodeoxychorismate synthase component I [Bacteroidales bacterium]
MEFLNREDLFLKINSLAKKNVPFLFLLDFKGENGIVVKIDDLAKEGISCAINGIEIGQRVDTYKQQYDNYELQTKPISFNQYKKGFDIVQHAIQNGDTYLLNLTYATLIISKLDMCSIYQKAKAPYKFMIKDKFVFYSPEPFIRIRDGIVSSFPMKGTISIKENDAYFKLLNDEKELREHYTIVDLIRNDLSIISIDVKVESFRYFEKIQTAKDVILQTSSKITGHLKDNWNEEFGDILKKIVPAGSISGAPKKRSVEIIEKAEITDRGFYSGVMGVYNNYSVDSCVIIRYIEKNKDSYYYRSGGGITSKSKAKEEYNELLTKIYVPTN